MDSKQYSDGRDRGKEQHIWGIPVDNLTARQKKGFYLRGRRIWRSLIGQQRSLFPYLHRTWLLPGQIPMPNLFVCFFQIPGKSRRVE